MRKISEAERENRREILRDILLAALGAGVSVGSFFLYYWADHVILTIAICLFDVGYTYWSACRFFDAQEWKGTKAIMIPMLMLFFWAIVFCVLCVGNAAMLGGDFSYDMFLYPVFLMPAFEVVFLVLIILGQGM